MRYASPTPTEHANGKNPLVKRYCPQNGPQVVRLVSQVVQVVTVVAIGYKIHAGVGALVALLLLAALVAAMIRYKIQDNENITQGAQLATCVALGYLFLGWVGSLLGFVVFAVLIMLTVRSKMALAQKVGDERRAARRASHVPWVNPNDPIAVPAPGDDAKAGS